VSREIKGIACDMEGTIFSVEECHHEGFAAAARTYGIDITFEDVVNCPGVIGAGDPGAIAAILKHYDREDIVIEEFRLRKMVHYDKLLETLPLVLRPGFEQFFLQLCQHDFRRGLPLVVASLTPKAQAKPLIEKSGLGRLVPPERIVLREDVARVKPAPDVFLKAAELIGVPPENLLVFGDSAKDMLAARAAGALPIGVPYYWRRNSIAELMDAGAEHIFRDWRTINFKGLLSAIAG